MFTCYYEKGVVVFIYYTDHWIQCNTLCVTRDSGVMLTHARRVRWAWHLNASPTRKLLGLMTAESLHNNLQLVPLEWRIQYSHQNCPIFLWSPRVHSNFERRWMSTFLWKAQQKRSDVELSATTQRCISVVIMKY